MSHRRHLNVLGMTILSAAIAAPASAQPSCGGTQVYNSLTPYGTSSTELIVRTQRDITACPLEVQAEGWIQGYGGASTDRNAYVAEVHRFDPIGINGTYYSSGKHWLIWYGGSSWTYLGATTGGPATITGGICSPPIPEHTCTDGGGHVSANGCTCEYDTPIIADVDGDGYRLTSIDDGVMFDLDADGDLEAVAWTRANSDDAFLVLDRNNNGKVDNGSELFGNATPAYNDEAQPPALNGFVALKFIEGPSYGVSHVDGIVNADDSVFGRLLLWQDKNHDGQSDPGELRPASSLGLVAVGSSYRESKRKDRHGNMFKLKSKSWWLVDGTVVQRPIFDVSLMSR